MFVGAALLARPADATTNRMPLQHVDRNLVVPKHTLRFDGGPRWPLPTGQVVHHINRDWNDGIWLVPGLSAGVIEDLEIGIAQPLLIHPDVDLQNPLFHGTYQFTRGTLDAGLFWGVRIPFEGHLVTHVGVPLYVHVSRSVRLDLGAFGRLAFPDDATFDLEAPFLVPINVTPQLFLGPETAIVTWGGFEGVSVPLGFFIGYTVTTGGGVLGDLSARIRERDVTEGDGLNTLELIFAADLFFDL